MADCPICGGEGRVLVVHPDTEVDPAAAEYSRLRIVRDPSCPPDTLYDMVCRCGPMLDVLHAELRRWWP